MYPRNNYHVFTLNGSAITVPPRNRSFRETITILNNHVNTLSAAITIYSAITVRSTGTVRSAITLKTNMYPRNNYHVFTLNGSTITVLPRNRSFCNNSHLLVLTFYLGITHAKRNFA